MIPENIESIGENCFNGIKGIKSLRFAGNKITVINKGVFSNLTTIDRFEIPESVTTIGKGAFSNSTGIEAIVIPKNVTRIYENAFDGCSDLKSVDIRSTKLEDLASAGSFQNCSICNLKISNEIKRLPNYLFEKTGFSDFDLVIPENIEVVGAYCFDGSTGVKSITFEGNKLASIESYAFGHITSIESIVIPESVTEFGSGVFSGCTNLRDVDIRCTQIVDNSGPKLFEYCSISNLRLSDSLTSMPPSMFREAGFSDCDVLIPAGMEKIGSYCFYRATGIKSITFAGDKITTIGEAAFQSCNSASGILRIPASVNEIGKSAFGGCRFGCIINNSSVKITLPLSFDQTWLDYTSQEPITGIANGIAVLQGSQIYPIKDPNAPITAISGIPKNGVQLSDSNTDKGKSISSCKTINLEITPGTSTVRIWATAEDKGLLFFNDDYDGNGLSTYSWTEQSLGTPDQLQLMANNDNCMGSRTDKLIIGMAKGKFGETTVHLTNGLTGDEKIEYASFKVFISGAKYNEEGTEVVGYYKQNGELVKNQYRYVSNTKYYFDDNGDVVTNGVVRIDDKYVLISYNLMVTTEGFWDFAGKTYYVKNDETAAADEIYTIDNKDYIFRADGTMVKYSDSDVKNGEYIFNGAAYTIDKTNNSAKLDDKKIVTSVGSFIWTPSANKNYVKDMTVTASVKVFYKYYKTQITRTAILPATVTLDPLSTDTKKIFNAAISANDYYKDSLTEYDWSEIKSTRTYIVDAVTGNGTQNSGNFGDNAIETGMFTAEFIDGDTYTYTGDQIRPAVIVNNGEKTLVEGIDYTLSYKNNINAAETGPLVIVQGRGNYTNKLEIPFKIAKMSLSDKNKVKIGGLTFKTKMIGNVGSIKPSVTYYGKVLNYNNDYIIEYGNITDSTDINGNPVKVMALTIKAEGAKKNNFTGSQTATAVFGDIAPAVTIEKFDTVNYIYDGTAKDPAAEGKIHIKGIQDSDFDAKVQVTYSDNVNAGICRVTITADGFSGKAVKSFKINPATASLQVDNEAELKAGMPYKSTGVTPYIKIVVNDSTSALDGTELVPGKDYKISYSNNKKVLKYDSGKAAPTAKIQFIGNYKNNKSLQSTTYTIKPAKLLESKVEVTMPSVMVFNSKKRNASAYMLKPNTNLVVTVNGVALTSSEYDVKYTANGEAITNNSIVNCGDVIGMKIIPKGSRMQDLYGTDAYPVPATYKLIDAGNKKDLSKAVVKFLNANDPRRVAQIGYTGTKIEFATSAAAAKAAGLQAFIEVKIDGVALTEEELTGLNIDYANNTLKGQARIFISANETSERFAGCKVQPFNIAAHPFDIFKDL